MTGEPISDDDLMTLFEAARRAPSSYNEQPWRFVYAKRDTAQWNPLFSLLSEWNQGWVVNASAIVLIVSKKTFAKNGSPNGTHSFDTGSAWMSLALQGASMGLVTHGMSGFDAPRAVTELGVPEDFFIDAMCAIGHLAEKEVLADALQEMEVPSLRRPLDEFVMHGTFTT